MREGYHEIRWALGCGTMRPYPGGFVMKMAFLLLFCLTLLAPVLLLADENPSAEGFDLDLQLASSRVHFDQPIDIAGDALVNGGLLHLFRIVANEFDIEHEYLTFYECARIPRVRTINPDAKSRRRIRTTKPDDEAAQPKPRSGDRFVSRGGSHGIRNPKQTQPRRADPSVPMIAQTASVVFVGRILTVSTPR